VRGVDRGLFVLLLPLASGATGAPRVRNISNPPTSADVFVVAHQDDWQLFMGDVAMKQITAGSHAVFIYLTAGDDGRDPIYWKTRERAALQSNRLAMGIPAPGSSAIKCSKVEIHAHSIQKCAVGNTDSYFLRLPDGKRNGKGFARYRYQSLRKLRTNRITGITAVDSSATYSNWKDLIATTSAIIDLDSAGVMVHAIDPSVVVNPHDHFDHRMAGLLVADARRKEGWNVVYYLGYALATRAENLSRDQSRQKVALFRAYDAEMAATDSGWSAYKEHPVFYSECMSRTYARRRRK
jgi:LmbE family N-acetylglucosaminyl deacetylase